MVTNYTSDQKIKTKGVVGKARTYNEVVEFLDSRTKIDYSEASLKRMQQLDECFDNVSRKIDVL